jgi:hypothetical protein
LVSIVIENSKDSSSSPLTVSALSKQAISLTEPSHLTIPAREQKSEKFLVQRSTVTLT